MSSEKVYRVGMLGFGFIGKVHAFAYRTLPFYYDPVPVATTITHVVTSCLETAERGRQMVDADVATTDYRTVTENPDIDIVHICTPNHLHMEALVSALRHGKHIYCDKPLVATWEQARQLQAILATYQGVGQMTFQNRFFPALLHARQLIQQGSLGDVLGFRINYLHGGSSDPNAPLKWKLSNAAGGGVIADLGSHVLDLIEHLAGRIQSVTACTHIAYADRPAVEDHSKRVAVDAEDSVIALARLESGATGTIEATKIATGMEDELRVELHGARGAIRFQLMDPHYLEFHDATANDRPIGGVRGWNRIHTGQRYEAPATGFPSPKASIGWLRAHVACLFNFLRAVADGRPAEPDLQQGIRVQRLMECLRRSASKQCWIDVDSV